MKFILFAGGSGKRLWPLTRKNKPKQLMPLKDSLSNLEIFINILLKKYSFNDIFISCNRSIAKEIIKRIPNFPTDNFIIEPAQRDVGPAGILALLTLYKKFTSETIAVCWTDDYFTELNKFLTVLTLAEEKLTQSYKFILLGWEDKLKAKNISSIDYSPQNTLKNGISYGPLNHIYLYLNEKAPKNKSFLNSTGFVIAKMRNFIKEIEINQTKVFNIIKRALQTNTLNSVYPKLKPFHFDNCLDLNKQPRETLVINIHSKIIDIGTFDRFIHLQEILKSKKVGYTFKENSKAKIINTEKQKLIVTFDVNDITIVNTDDVLYIVSNKKSADTKKLLAKLEKNPSLKKYL